MFGLCYFTGLVCVVVSLVVIVLFVLFCFDTLLPGFCVLA